MKKDNVKKLSEGETNEWFFIDYYRRKHWWKNW
jgi:hypothetical protein